MRSVSTAALLCDCVFLIACPTQGLLACRLTAGGIQPPVKRREEKFDAYNGDTVVEYWTQDVPGGQEGRFTEVWVKEKGAWICAAAHASIVTMVHELSIAAIYESSKVTITGRLFGKPDGLITKVLGGEIAFQLTKVGYVPLAEIGAEFLFQVIAERAERATLIVTTNLPFSEWTQVFPNPRLCKALLDRITDRAHIIETGTESYRFRRTVEGRQKKKAS